MLCYVIYHCPFDRQLLFLVFTYPLRYDCCCRPYYITHTTQVIFLGMLKSWMLKIRHAYFGKHLWYFSYYLYYILGSKEKLFLHPSASVMESFDHLISYIRMVLLISNLIRWYFKKIGHYITTTMYYVDFLLFKFLRPLHNT